ncbi:MAG: host-nuclease inhibitor Gam family protein [candidate division WOR-3 bacterium]
MKENDDIKKLKALEEVESILFDIDNLQDELAVQKKAYEEDMRIVKDRYQKSLEHIKQEIEKKEKALKTLLKNKQSIIFSDGEVVHLRNGSVWHRVVSAVKKARQVTVELLEQLGYLEGIKIVKSVNWDVISKWSDEKLAVIGTERVEKEEFGYDLVGRQ